MEEREVSPGSFIAGRIDGFCVRTSVDGIGFQGDPGGRSKDQVLSRSSGGTPAPRATIGTIRCTGGLMLSCLALFIGRRNLATRIRTGLVKVVRAPLLLPAKACSKTQGPSSRGGGFVDDRGPVKASCTCLTSYVPGGRP